MIDIGDDPQSIREHVIGASEIESDEAEYTLELSTEFLVDKCKKNSKSDKPELTMFLRSGPLDEKRTERRVELLTFVRDADYCINTIENLYNLLENDDVDLIRKYFLESSNGFVNSFRENIDYNKVINKLDAMLAVKHFVNSLLTPLMPEGVFRKLYDIMNVKVRGIVQSHTSAFMDFLKQLDGDSVEAYLYRIPKFIVDYIKVVGQLIPLYDNYSKFDSIDLNKSGISTMSVDEMVVIYKKGYELLCDSIDLIVALNNISHHGTYDNFGCGKVDFDKKLNGYPSKYVKYQEVTNNDYDLFDGLRGKLNNIIRNAEGHNSIRIDGLNQNITFTNKRKGNVDTYTISFLEFGKNCIDLFVAILHIWEFYYQTIKFKSVFIDEMTLNYGK
ncbi:MAG: hypothetical protein K6G74_04805 [Bacilli bacterium]|nr:hypothetical protein [Bacilli bacterium]